MQNLTLSTTPSEKKLYAVKYYEGDTFPLPYHNHERYELTLIIKGNGLRFVGDSVEEFSKGDVVLIGPYLPHKWQIDEAYPKDKQVKAISVFFQEGFPSTDFNTLAELSNINELKRKAKFGVTLDSDIKKGIAQKIKSLLDHIGVSRMLFILQILEDVATSAQYHTLSTVKMNAKTDLNNQRIQRVTNYINDNINTTITLDDVSKIACMHRNSIGRFFKKSIGFSIIEYTNLVRIGKASRLLIETDKKISGIALECGFENLSHFNRMFKKLKDMTPLEYRQHRKPIR